MPARHHPSSPPTPRNKSNKGNKNVKDSKESKDGEDGKNTEKAQGLEQPESPEGQKSQEAPKSGDSSGLTGSTGGSGSTGGTGGSGKVTPLPELSPASGSPAPERSSPGRDATAVGRIPVLDVRPLVQQGRRPAKAVTGETFEVSATVFREGHDAVAANVVLRDPDGGAGPWTPMRELAPGTDRWGADVTPDAPGRWTYSVEAWSDPVATWRHHARIKIPAGMDTELVLAEGSRLYERAAAGVPEGPDRAVVLTAVDALRDETRPAVSRLAAALTPEVDAVLGRHPLRELVTASEPLPLLVERERALYGAWYEF
ncbi:maltotransferase domain-containing protein, partial [Streptomyces sp. NPDC060000]|uniref:maltotransferase domain-containing protein n=1 Tax=Streptomyces sp. NPDC060000 TaxID=3347031 RepID=UPI0036A18DB1